MDLDKALYMSEFLKIREDLGTTEIYPDTNTLYSNLYDEFKQNEKIEEAFVIGLKTTLKTKLFI